MENIIESLKKRQKVVVNTINTLFDDIEHYREMCMIMAKAASEKAKEAESLKQENEQLRQEIDNLKQNQA